MLKPVTHITINNLFFDFCHSWEFSDKWTDMTSGGKVTLPKNIYVVDTNTNRRTPLFGLNKNIGGFNSNPIIKKGDKIKIEAYYICWDENNNETFTPKKTIVEGYIAKVSVGTPIVLEFEDNMHLLKQIPMKNQSFNASTSLESIFKDALLGTDLTVNFLTDTTIKFDNCLLSTENETVAQFLARLRKDFFFKSYFRGNELRIGSLIYIESEANEKIFEFQQNIIKADLVYSRKDDVVLSAIASNHIEEKTGKFTKSGVEKTTKKRIEVLVTLKNDKLITKSVKKGEQPDPNIEGEKRTFFYPFAKTEQELINLAEIDLRKYYYSGFKGKFTTFGTPYVQFGDNARIINKLLPEQNGLYKIKAVDYSSGIDGYRQEITLDYRINE